MWIIKSVSLISDLITFKSCWTFQIGIHSPGSLLTLSRMLQLHSRSDSLSFILGHQISPSLAASPYSNTLFTASSTAPKLTSSVQDNSNLLQSLSFGVLAAIFSFPSLVLTSRSSSYSGTAFHITNKTSLNFLVLALAKNFWDHILHSSCLPLNGMIQMAFSVISSAIFTSAEVCFKSERSSALDGPADFLVPETLSTLIHTKVWSLLQ